MRRTSYLLAISVFVALATSHAPAFADKVKGGNVLGGVNLDYYCKQTHGTAFKAKLVGPTAGDWTCERNQNDRREISVEHACKLQYGKNNLRAKAINWNNPLSWVCVQYGKIK